MAADLRGLPHRVVDQPALLPADRRPTLRLPFGAPSRCPDRLTPASSPGVGPVARVSPDAWPSRPSVSFAPSCEGPMRVHSRLWAEAHDLRLSDANPKVLFRPRGFSPPRRFSPRYGAQACCILLPTLGFVPFHPTSRSQPRSPRRDHPSKDDPNRSWYSGHPEPWPPWRSSLLTPSRRHHC
jgi:hypothetical protein